MTYMWDVGPTLERDFLGPTYLEVDTGMGMADRPFQPNGVRVKGSREDKMLWPSTLLGYKCPRLVYVTRSRVLEMCRC